MGSYIIVDTFRFNYDTLSIISKEYKKNPILYAYVLYDLIYETDKTYVAFKLKEDEIVGYLLLWKGMKPNALHVYGDVIDLLDRCLPLLRDETIIHTPPELSKYVIAHLNKYGEIKYLGTFLDMLTDLSNFKPYYPEKAIRLREIHVEAYIKVKNEQGRMLSYEEALDRLLRWRYYGVFVGDKLVSIACSYLRLPELWIIGDVYTLREYRGKGFAKIVTSAITRDAVNCSGKALLHVREDNVPAIRVYSRLGYRVMGKKCWYMFKPWR